MSDYLSTPQVAAAVGVHRDNIRRHCVAGHLPGACRVGRNWLVPARYADPTTYRAAVGRPGRRAKRG